jgi:hypothetical protein
MIRIGGRGWHKPGKVNGRPGPRSFKYWRHFHISLFARSTRRF